MAIDLSQGQDVALRRTALGKFDLDFIASGPGKGNPKLSNDRTHAVVTTMFSKKRGRRPGSRVQQGGYYFDSAGRRGTLLWSIVLDRGATRSELLGAGQDGGQQLLDDKLITRYNVDATHLATGRWAVQFTWSTPAGDRKETLVL